MVAREMLRQLPAVDEVLRAPEVAALLDFAPRGIVVQAVREVLDRWRRSIMEGNAPEGRRESITSRIVKEVREEVKRSLRPRLRRVINATGVVLHTNLGRAVLAGEAQEAVHMAASGYSNLELDLASGKRGSRYVHLEELLTGLTGAEAAMVVNNNAGAVLLALSTLARGREVIVSRGQLVEIGGSFRIPDVMAQSGAILVEVGTTNKTYPQDYRRAIGPQTALLLHVHTSNYRLVGFVREITVAELVSLGREYNLPVMSDLGSGSLVDLSALGLPHEPTVQETVAAGADVVTFSGDKLLGGPQAGIIVGRRQYIEMMRKNPLTRALRVDKLTVAALEATLRLYLEPQKALAKVPALRMLTAPKSEIAERAEAAARRLRGMLAGKALVEVEATFSQVGGGAMPTAEIPSAAVTIRPRAMSVSELAQRLRGGEPAVMGRLQEDRLVLDLRTVLPEEEEDLLKALVKAVLGGEES